jgi:hypothetical protein
MLSIVSHVRSGSLRGLAVTTKERVAGGTGYSDHRRVRRARLRPMTRKPPKKP